VSRDPLLVLADMLEACERISRYCAGLDAVALREDMRTIDAVVRNLEVLGEAAKRVSPEHKALLPALPWREMAGMRDVLIHDYFGVDLDVVCDVALTKVPAIATALSELLGTLDRP
jgi:uncharacterized protein with HEPN domain